MKKVLVLALVAATGGLVGSQVTYKKAKLQGELRSCQRIFSVLKKSGAFPLECTVDSGEVILTSVFLPGLKMSLDGEVLAPPTAQQPQQ